VAGKGERSGWYFVAAWGSFLCGIGMLALNKFGVLPRTLVYRIWHPAWLDV
jgi:hypothetical protein